VHPTNNHWLLFNHYLYVKIDCALRLVALGRETMTVHSRTLTLGLVVFVESVGSGREVPVPRS
jgi:hypothetical protein